MFSYREILLIIGFALVFNAKAKPADVDHVLVVQNLINQAYKLGYVDAAPLEVAAVEKKLIQARELRDKRNKKEFLKLIDQVKVDLKIVKKRHEVNLLNENLLKLQEQNIQAKKALNELKGQL